MHVAKPAWLCYIMYIKGAAAHKVVSPRYRL